MREIPSVDELEIEIARAMGEGQSPDPRAIAEAAYAAVLRQRRAVGAERQRKHMAARRARELAGQMEPLTAA